MTIIRSGIEALVDTPILDVFRLAALTPDVLSFLVGEPDLPTSRFICDAASQALVEGRTFYSHNRGLPALRAAIAAYHQRLYGAHIPDDRIAFTVSGMNAVMQTVQATLTAGDHAVVVTPSWPNIMRAIEINGATVTELLLAHDDRGWQLSLGRLFDACRSNTRLIYLASPGNPTGWMIPRADAERLLAFCRERSVALLSDEVYHRIVYDRPVAFSFLEIARPEDPLFVVHSFSKSWAMTGWRMGWLIYPAGCTPTFEKLIQFNTSGGLEFMQAAGIVALTEGEDFVRFFVERCRAAHDIAAERLAAIPRIRPIPTAGSFYAMFEIDGVEDTYQFCIGAVRDAQLAMAPGIAFGAGAANLVRICYAKEPELLHRGFDRLAAYLRDVAP